MKELLWSKLEEEMWIDDNEMIVVEENIDEIMDRFGVDEFKVIEDDCVQYRIFFDDDEYDEMIDFLDEKKEDYIVIQYTR